jgi:hypothetical protein
MKREHIDMTPLGGNPRDTGMLPAGKRVEVAEL